MPMYITADLEFDGSEKRLFVLGDQQIELIKKCQAERIDYNIDVFFPREGDFKNVFGAAGIALVKINENTLAQVDDATGCVLGIPTKNGSVPAKDCAEE